MWQCPRCKRQNENTLICVNCGFDESKNYERYLSVVLLPQKVREQAKTLYYQEEEKSKDGFWEYYQGLCYYYGITPGENGFDISKKNIAKATKFMEKAAALGYAEAYYELANKVYLIDYDKSLEYYQKGAESGSVNAVLALEHEITHQEELKRMREQKKQGQSYGMSDMAETYGKARQMEKGLYVLCKCWEQVPNRADKIKVMTLEDILKHPLDYYYAYGMRKYAVELVSSSLEDRKRIVERIRQASVRLYNDLLFYYSSNYVIGKDKGFWHGLEQVKQRFSIIYEDCYDAYRLYMLGRLYWNTGRGQEGQLSDMVRLWEGLESIFPLAKAWLGQSYREGKGTKKEEKKADSIQKAAYDSVKQLADLGNAEAQYYIASQLYYQKQYEEALRYFSLAWRGHCMMAACFLGNFYYYGLVVEQDFDQAFAYYSLALWSGNMEIVGECLGNCWYYGRGVSVSKKVAGHYYYLAAQQGSQQAMFSYGMMLLAQEVTPKHDDKIAVDTFGTTQLANRFSKFKANEIYALAWLLHSAELGYAKAQMQLGDMYARGVSVEKDLAQAEQWYQRACDQHYAAAFYPLGCVYYQGRGVKRDVIYALQLWREGVALGNIESLRAHACVVLTYMREEESLKLALKDSKYFCKKLNQSFDKELLARMYWELAGQSNHFSAQKNALEEAAKQYKLAYELAIQEGAEDESVLEMRELFPNVLKEPKKDKVGRIMIAWAQVCLAVKMLECLREKYLSTRVVYTFLNREWLENTLELKAISFEDKNSIQLLEQAAERPNGDGSAEYLLGICYEYGLGVIENRKQMKLWTRKAAVKGHEYAKKKAAKWWF